MRIGFGRHTQHVIRGSFVGVDCSVPDSGHLVARCGIERWPGTRVTPHFESVSTRSGSAPDPAAAAYCAQQGGQVQTRSAFWGTNGDQTGWLPLAGSASMCRFQADDEAKSRIYVDLTTLYSAEPILAGLAYLSRVPMPTTKGGGNPATAYCTNLGGSSTFGSVSAAGGGWVAQGDEMMSSSLCASSLTSPSSTSGGWRTTPPGMSAARI